jgi:hypothetical protein
LALLEEALQEPLSFGRAPESRNRIRRHRDHANGFSFVDPHEPISLVDLIPLADRRRNIGLTFPGDSGFHGILLNGL